MGRSCGEVWLGRVMFVGRGMGREAHNGYWM